MKAITIAQPYATLIALGLTPYHALNWSDEYRGPIAIHAASDKTDKGEQLAQEREFYDLLKSKNLSYDKLPFGAIIATAELLGVHPTSTLVHNISRLQRKIIGGKHHNVPHTFEFFKVKPLAEPVAHKNGNGLWEWKEAEPAKTATKAEA